MPDTGLLAPKPTGAVNFTLTRTVPDHVFEDIVFPGTFGFGPAPVQGYGYASQATVTERQLLGPGAYSLTAGYSGDSTYNPVNATTTFVVSHWCG